ncbi:MAG: serine kinase [Paracoccaceae bacterium]
MTVPASVRLFHASCIALQDPGVEAGLLILGPSGSGKSSLALMLMAFGARLVADDNTLVRRQGGRLRAEPVPATAGLVEARGIGILRTAPPQATVLTLAVDLGTVETERLPPRRHIDVMGIALPLVLGPATPHLAAALFHLLRYPRQA